MSKDHHRPEFHCFSRHVLIVLNFVGPGVNCDECGQPAPSFVAFRQIIHVLMFQCARQTVKAEGLNFFMKYFTVENWFKVVFHSKF